jgi:hypothetical protein
MLSETFCLYDGMVFVFTTTAAAAATATTVNAGIIDDDKKCWCFNVKISPNMYTMKFLNALWKM